MGNPSLHWFIRALCLAALVVVGSTRALAQTVPPPPPPDPEEGPEVPTSGAVPPPSGAFPPPPPDGPAVPYNLYPTRRVAVLRTVEAPAEPSPNPELRPDPSPATRYTLEALGGLGVGTALGLGGALLGLGLAAASAPRGRDFSIAGAVGTVTFGMLGFFFGLPWGVRLVGNARGGNGGYGWSLLGSLLGGMGASLLAFPIAGAAGGGTSTGTEFALGVLTIASMTTGAVLGYELSNDQHALSRQTIGRGPSVTLAPLGTGLQLVGSF